MSNLSIGYFNIRGLSTDKWIYCCSLIQSSLFDILFITETWYMNKNMYQAHPYYLISSPDLMIKRTTGHQSGGLLVLINPLIRSHISSFKAEKYFISLIYYQKHIVGLYLPPSMSIQNINLILTSFSKVDVMIGDINTHYGQLFYDSTTGPKDRIDSFAYCQALYNLTQCFPISGKTRVDHAFINNNISATLIFTEPTINTDHPLLSLNIDWGQVYVSNNRPSKLKRFYLKYLDDRELVEQLNATYDHSTEWLQEYLKDIYHNITSFELADIQYIINTAYDNIVYTITEVANIYLGTYEVSIIKEQPDHLAKIQSFKDTTAALRLFKRSLRAFTYKSFIHSRSSELTPLEDAVQFYKAVFCPEDGKHNNASLWQYAIPSLNESGFEVLNAYSADTIKKFIKSYPRGKSCGLDSLHICLLKALLPSKLSLHLAYFFRICARVGYTPDIWNLSIIFPIPKVEGAMYIDTFRPISLTSMLRRCFEKILLQTLYSSIYFSPIMTLSPLQAGFRKGFSTLSHALLSNDAVHFGIKIKVFIDLKQAYDRVSIPILLEKLKGRVVCPILISLIGSLFAYCSSQVVVNSQLSDIFTREFGLFQGSLLAPLLFDIYIDDLALCVAAMQNSDTPIPSGLFFADDIQLLAKTVIEAQTFLNIVIDWCQNNNMVINLDKSAFVSLIPDTYLTIGDIALNQVKKYKYLGFPQTATIIDWQDYFQTCLNKGAKFLNSLRISANHWPAWAKLAVYRAFLRPLFEYGAPLLWHYINAHPSILVKDFLEPCQDLQDNALIWIFRKKSSALILHSLAALPRICNRFLSLATLFVKHIQNLHSSNPVGILLKYCKSHPPWSSTLLTPRCITTELSIIYPDLLLNTLSYKKLSIFLKKWYIDQISMKSTLSSYILPICRVKEIGVDRLLFCKSDIFNAALNWRCNHFSLYSTCPVCRISFSRTHIHNCNLLSQCMDLSSDNWSLYKSEYQEIFSNTNYTILDSLLNHKQYDIFYSCIQFLNVYFQTSIVF